MLSSKYLLMQFTNGVTITLLMHFHTFALIPPTPVTTTTIKILATIDSTSWTVYGLDL